MERPEGMGTAEALTAAGVMADEDTLDRWAAVIDDATGEGRDDDPHLQDLSPSGRQRILVHALDGLLRAGSERGPMLVVLDDLHWADPASLAVVEELLAQLPSCGSFCWRRTGPTGRTAGRAGARTSSSTSVRCGPRTRG